MKLSEVVEKYIEIRDRREQRKREFREADAADESLQAKIEAKLLEVFHNTGMDSVKTAAGTAYMTSRTAATVADKEAFMQFIQQTGEYPLLEVRASKTAVEQYKEAHETLPPGINWREEQVVNIRRAA